MATSSAQPTFPPPPERPHVAVVVLSYQGAGQLRQFLPSVLQHSSLPPALGAAQVWVVDNASTDDTPALLPQAFPQARVITLPVNRGFTNGYVESLPQIEADYYVLINADVEVTSGWLEPLVYAMQADATLFAVQPKILAQRQPTHFEYSGAAGGYIDAWGYPFCRGRLFTTLEADTGQHDAPHYCFWATGACMLVRADAYHALGGLDNDFYAHMEEIDLCWRAINRGYRVAAIPSSVAYHVGGHVITYGSLHKAFRNYRNNLLMLVKNYRGWLWGLLLWRMVLDGIAGLRGLLSGHPSELRAVLKAHGQFYGLLGRFLRKRKALKPHWAPTWSRAGWLRGSLVWQYFVRGRKHFTQLKGLQQEELPLKP